MTNVGDTATVNLMNEEAVTGRVYHIRENGWLCVVTEKGRHSSGPEIIKATENVAGCWIEGSWGVYGATRLIEIAEGHGFYLTDDDKLAMQYYNANENEKKVGGIMPSEYILDQGGLEDCAEEFLNTFCAPEGYFFGWYEGEFYLWDDSSWEEM